MANQQHLKFSGMLNQHEFTERYLFTLRRIANGFSRRDLAFLLGRATDDLTDYEQLAAHVKMNYNDHETMASVFKRTSLASPIFYTKANETDISNERRMIRGIIMETEDRRYLDFVHPWKIRGDQKDLTITESLSRDDSQDLQINEYLYKQLLVLKNSGCFDPGCTALLLYQQINSVIDKKWKPLFLSNLRNMVFAQIYSKELYINQKDGRVTYKIKS